MLVLRGATCARASDLVVMSVWKGGDGFGVWRSEGAGTPMTDKMLTHT